MGTSITDYNSVVCKPWVFKFNTQLEMSKIYHKGKVEHDMTNCDVSMTSYSNVVEDKGKNFAISCSGPNFSLITLKFGTGVNLKCLF